MLAKRIIPCMDIDRGRVVKGVKFINIKDAGDPVEVARRYNQQKADEITFLDITASQDNRPITINTVKNVATEVFIPLTVGGGIRSLGDIHAILNAGADKVSINTMAVEDPNFIKKASQHFGKQCIVVSIDAKKMHTDFRKPRWEIFTHGGRNKTGIDAIEWAKKMVRCGSGELLVTSIDKDGTKDGLDIELIRQITNSVPVPVIASGGIGKLDHLVSGISDGGADAILAASIFHFGEYTILDAKQHMASQGIMVRL